MQFLIERASDQSLSKWEAISGRRSAVGFGADICAVEQLALRPGIYRARPAAPPDQVPTVFSVDSEGNAFHRATV
jgi:hypothetical protein